MTQKTLPKQILIVKWGALGDILATTPTILKVQELFPDAAITLLSTSLAKKVFKDSKIITEVLDRKKNIMTNILFLRRKKFDIALNLQWGSEGADLYTFLSGAKIKIGGSSKKYLRNLYDYKPPFLETDCNRHEYLKNLDILSAYKKVNEKNIRAFIPTRSSAEISSFLEGKKDFIIISPAASTLKKAWKKKRYIALSRMIIKKYKYDIIVTYAPEDKEYASDVVQSIGKGAFLSPIISINEAAYLVQQSQLCICNNSGIMHIAYAVNTPVLCFNTSIGWHPFGKNDISLDRIPDDLADNRALHNDRVEQLISLISIEEAFDAFESFQKKMQDNKLKDVGDYK